MAEIIGRPGFSIPPEFRGGMMLYRREGCVAWMINFWRNSISNRTVALERKVMCVGTSLRYRC